MALTSLIYSSRAPAVAAPPVGGHPPSTPQGAAAEFEHITTLKHHLSTLERELSKVKADVHRALGSASARKTLRPASAGAVPSSSRSGDPVPVDTLRDRLTSLTSRFSETLRSARL
jgi:hypothetical protein